MEARLGSLQRLERESTGQVGGPGEPPGSHQRQRRHRRHELRAVDQRQAFLRGESDRLEPGGSERVGPAVEGPVEPRMTLADERQRQMRERVRDRRLLRPSRERARAAGRPVETLDQQLHRLDVGARVALRERVRPEQHRARTTFGG
jgi:hypothetical protein